MRTGGATGTPSPSQSPFGTPFARKRKGVEYVESYGADGNGAADREERVLRRRRKKKQLFAEPIREEKGNEEDKKQKQEEQAAGEDVHALRRGKQEELHDEDDFVDVKASLMINPSKDHELDRILDMVSTRQQ